MNLTELKKALWVIIAAEEIEVTNQNIDWLIERAYKLTQKIMEDKNEQ